mmetsp:Transcript_8659/g.26057  ORF Transcript_8659/g.26057 Transcript_8659/m.26057 type:complete len:205 (-) Transcript_8659:2-616(-)
MADQDDTPSRRLLEALERSANNPETPIGPYQEAAMRELKDECNALYGTVQELMEDAGPDLADLDDASKARLVVYHEQIKRQKHVALVYLRERLAAMTKVRQEAGFVLPDAMRSNLSPAEAEFYADYDKLFTAYGRESRLDLGACRRPPKDLYVEIRCNVDCGEIVTQHSGVVKLDKGTSHYLRRDDVERLIAQGMVSHVKACDK